MKQAKVEVRCTSEEKSSWQEAAGGPRKVSAWLRALANAAAHAGNGNAVVETLVTEGSAVVIEKAKVPLSTDGMIRAGSANGRRTDSESVGGGSTPSPAAQEPAVSPRKTFKTRASTQGAQDMGSASCPRWFSHRSGVYCGTCRKIIK